MTQVFLNYRADDEKFGVALIDRALSEKFGESAVFFASRSIDLGAEWEREMFDAVRRSDALLVIMGRNWLESPVPGTGHRRIDDPCDFVRREIETAFELGKQVIPVRLDVRRFTAEELPETLRSLPELQDIHIHCRTTKTDIDQLAERLRKLIPSLPAAEAPPVYTTPKFVGTAHAGGTLTQADRIEVAGDFFAGPRFP
ncbi:toll/interleukin-1 receptor domain-containing protein [Amycolatopsis sp. NEAU-NG30]|uniref:Toll/interleukin-1 receptor domain-containing protein n=1 Tax=Amycolatopsis melonis TaxID=3156488 RepID=A0ABV0LE32_9PSEU